MNKSLRARYLVETSFELEQAAEILAGEQSSGTFVKIPGETDQLRVGSRNFYWRIAYSDHSERAGYYQCRSLFVSANHCGPDICYSAGGQPWKEDRSFINNLYIIV